MIRPPILNALIVAAFVAVAGTAAVTLVHAIASSALARAP
jgi:hypothetical protein